MTQPAQPPTELRIERAFRAPARAVFRAWTDPEVMRRWWHAGHDWETSVAEVDLRVGGRVRIVMRTPAGEEYGAHGEYTEVRPFERLALAWSWDDDPPGRRSLVEVDFREADGTTTVVLTHTGLSDERSKQGHEEGWHEVLDNLGRTVEGEAR